MKGKEDCLTLGCGCEEEFGKVYKTQMRFLRCILLGKRGRYLLLSHSLLQGGRIFRQNYLSEVK